MNFVYFNNKCCK